MEQIILFSLMISALYALIAMGFTMIFGVAGILNLAHGAFIMISAYTAYVSQTYFFKNITADFSFAGRDIHLLLDPYIACLVAVVFTSLLAVAFYEGLHRFARVILSLAVGVGIYLGVVQFLGAESLLRTLLTANLMGAAGAIASFFITRRTEGLTAIAILTVVGYLSALTTTLQTPLLVTGIVMALVGVLFFWLVGVKQKLKWEHAIFFPIVTVVVNWAHFVMQKSIFESLLTGIPVGLLFTVGVVRYIQQSPVITLIVTLAMALLIEQFMIIFFRYDVRLLPPSIESSVNVHTDPGALVMAILQAIILTLILAFWAYRVFSAYARRGPTLHWVGIGLLVLVVEHGLTLLNAGKFGPETAANIAYSLFGLGIASSLALAIFTYFYLRQNAASYAWLTALGLGVLLLVEQVAFLYYAWDAQSVSLLFGNARVYDLKLIANRLLLFAVAAAVIALFWYFVQRTRTGKAILATSMDQEGAALVGIDVRRVYTLTWALSGALAGVAGVFLAAWLPMLPVMWRDPLITSFAIVVLGGLGSLKGSLIAAGLIGFAETLTAYSPQIQINLSACDPNSFQSPCYSFDLLGPSWVGVPSLIILILILFLRPKGLFGREFE